MQSVGDSDEKIWCEGRETEEDEEDMRVGGIADARKASEGSNEKS